MKDFSKIYQLKGLKPKNKSHTNFNECCDLTKKSISNIYSPKTNRSAAIFALVTSPLLCVCTCFTTVFNGDYFFPVLKCVLLLAAVSNADCIVVFWREIFLRVLLSNCQDLKFDIQL